MDGPGADLSRIAPARARRASGRATDAKRPSGVGDVDAPRAVSEHVWLAAEYRDVFEQPGVELAQAAERGFLGVADVVEVGVVAVEHAGVRAAIDEFEFGRGLEGCALDGVQ